MTGCGTGDNKVTFWRQRQGEESGGGGYLDRPWKHWAPWVLVMMSCLQGLRTFSAQLMCQEGPLTSQCRAVQHRRGYVYG